MIIEAGEDPAHSPALLAIYYYSLYNYAVLGRLVEISGRALNPTEGLRRPFG
jgi:hypothetical protein